MKHKLLIHTDALRRAALVHRTAALVTLIGLSLLFSACSSASQAATATPEAAPTVSTGSTIIAEGRLEPVRYVEIAFTTGGVVGEVSVEEGQTIKKGDLLVRLGDELDTNYAAAQLELANAQKALNDLKNTAGTDQAQAVIDLKEAQEQYDEAEEHLRYLQNSKEVRQTQNRSVLVQTVRGPEYRRETRTITGPAPEEWIIEAENDLGLEKAELEAAQEKYNRMKDGVDVQQLAVLEARLNAAKAGVAAFSLIAPFDGVVAKVNAKAGGSIEAGEVAVTVADFSGWLVNTTDLTEIDVVELSNGQPVVVTLDALPDVELKGKILSIGQNYAENQGDVVYEVTVVLDDTHPAMRWGMTASVTFDPEE